MKNLFVTATKHGEGKSLVTMGLMAHLSKKTQKIGYFKPVGRASPRDNAASGVDGDVLLMKETYRLPLDVQTMNPLCITKGFPIDWVTKSGREDVVAKVSKSYEAVAKDKDFVIVEGTGNAATGAAYGLSNAHLAKQFNSKVLLISSGGVGQPIDEILLNKNYFERYGVDILGVIINKAFPHEIDTINTFMKRILDFVNVKIFGVIPYQQELTRPTMKEIMLELGGHCLGGEPFMGNKIEKTLLGTTSVRGLQQSFEGNVTLVVAGDREEIIHSALIAAYVTRKKDFAISGIIVAGRIKPSDYVLVPLKKTNLPVVWVESDSYTVASTIHSMNTRIAVGDRLKIKLAEDLVAKHVEIDAIVEALTKEEKK